MPDMFDQYAHQRPDTHPTIYAYTEVSSQYSKYIKVGYTGGDAEERVAQQYPTLRPGPNKPYKILYTESAMRPDGSAFNDHDVHRMLQHKGHPRLKGPDGRPTEWFDCTVNDVKAAVYAVRMRNLNLENRTAAFSMRPEQRWAVDKTESYFQKEHANGRIPKFLWNAKMRFGKTFAAYQLAKRLDAKRILVLTFKPAVESAWEEDLLTHVDFEGWQFYSRKTAELTGLTPEQLDPHRPIVCFGSFQDYLGTNDAGGIKAKNEWVHTTNWDLVIFDEYHFGAWRENAKRLFDQPDDDSYDALDIEKYKKEEADNAYNESFLPITTQYYLYLSGTPFRALNNGEFIEDEIFNWTYSDEQREKADWKGPGPNPYAALPRMVMMTYRIPDSIRRIAYNEQFNEFDLNLFFSASYEKGQPVTTARFVYEDYVQKWLDLIHGDYLPSTIDDLKVGLDRRPVMPFTDARLLNILTHTLWFLPNVASCWAMKNLLDSKHNVFFHDYTVNVCAGQSAGIGLDALAPVQQSMGDPLKTKTITLSCGKLTTGVTVKPWTGILMLRNLSSPETYFQAAFRVQSPWTVPDDKGGTQIIKSECYVFDFALDRALRQIADYSCRLNIKESNPEKKVGEFVHFLPVLAYDGSTMKSINAAEVLDLAMAGTSATLLARRWESALLVNVDNGTLEKILNNPEAMTALMNIEGFRSLNQDIETIINKSNAVKKAKKEGEEGLTPKQKKQLSEDEKEYKSKRKMIQEKLIKFATRIPVFMYLTDFREYSLKDVITQFEPGLFKKVTGLSTKEFNLLVSIGVFNDSLMNEAIYKFKRYEDSSLEYAGIRMHSDAESVGLFSTVISHEDYVKMAEQQSASMSALPVAVMAGNTDNRAADTRTGKARKNIASGAKPAAAMPEVTTTKPAARPTPAPDNVRLTGEFAGEVAPAKPAVKSDISDVKVGSRVEHTRFGLGTVTALRLPAKGQSGLVTVRFVAGEKTFGLPFVFENGIMKVME